MRSHIGYLIFRTFYYKLFIILILKFPESFYSAVIYEIINFPSNSKSHYIFIQSHFKVAQNIIPWSLQHLRRPLTVPTHAYEWISHHSSWPRKRQLLLGLFAPSPSLPLSLAPFLRPVDIMGNIWAFYLHIWRGNKLLRLKVASAQLAHSLFYSLV